MPEGPECRRMALQLSEEVSNKKLIDIVVESGRYTKKPIVGLEEVLTETPLTVRGTGVHGKFIFFLLDNEWSIWNTLGMTGGWSRKASKHARVRLVLEDGPIFYNDTRNFGTLKLVQGKQPIIDKLNSLGPDLLAEECPDEVFVSSLRRKSKKTIVEALMDQSVVSGVGNYVKAEALYLSKISPHRAVSSLTNAELCDLNAAVRSVLVNSFESGGATLQSYQDFYGEVGDATQRFAVYGRKADPEGREIIKEQTKDGRTTHWVPEVQL
tara:strand:- start:691 stop:1494 length:804 start_codon:yes stop_codon:yes gene_type:complete